MLVIRFSRVGKRNKAQFKITLQEKTVAPGGRHVEILGSYDPHSKQTVLKEDRIKYWIEKGAQASDTVWNLLVKNNVISGEKRAVKMKKKPVEEGKAEEAKTEETKEAKAEDRAVKEDTNVEAPAGMPENAPAEAPKEEVKAEEAKNEEKTVEESKEEKPVGASTEASAEEVKAEEAKAEEKPEEPKKEEAKAE